MRNHRFGIAAAGVIATAALAAGVATAATSAGSATAVPFKASYAGTAVVKVDGNVADITATGKGKGTPIGVGKITGKGKGDSSVQPCIPFTGTGALVGPGTTKLTFKVVPGSSGCGDEGGQVFSISAKATVIKGYGKLANVRGKLKITGVYDRGKGTFTAKFTGTLTK